MKSSSPLSRRYSSCIQWLLVILLIGIVWAGLAYGIHRVMAGNTVGMDFHIYWQAARAILIDHANPYGDEVAIKAQLGVLRRLSTTQDDQMGFAYPLFSLLPVLPLGYLPFDWAQAVWLSFNILLISISALIGFRGQRPGTILFLMLVYPFTFGLILGNFVIAINAILIFLYARLLIPETQRKKVLFLMGFVLAWTIGKPQFVWLHIGFLMLIALRKKNTALMAGFGIGLLVFMGLSFAIIPNWLQLWIERIQLYAQYVHTDPYGYLLFAAFLPPAGAKIGSLLLFTGMGLGSLWIIYRWWKNSIPDSMALAWIGLATYLIHPNNVAYAQTAFFLPMFIWLQVTGSPKWVRVVIILCAIVVSWAAFFLVKNYPQMPRIEELRLLFVTIWAGWLLLTQLFEPNQSRLHNTSLNTQNG